MSKSFWPKFLAYQIKPVLAQSAASVAAILIAFAMDTRTPVWTQRVCLRHTRISLAKTSLANKFYYDMQLGLIAE